MVGPELVWLGLYGFGKRKAAKASIPRGGYFKNFWVGMCRWDPGTLNLYQS